MSHILEHRQHPLLVGQWPGMVLPWTSSPCRGDDAVLSVTRRNRSGSRAGQADARIAPLVISLVCMVVGDGQPGGFLLLGGRQAELLPPVSARHGPVDRLDVGSPGASRPWPGHEALAAAEILQAQWVLMFVAAVVAPLVFVRWLPEEALALVSWHRAAVGGRGRPQRTCLETRGRLLDPRAGRGGLRARCLDRVRHHRPRRKRTTQPSRYWHRGFSRSLPARRPYAHVLQRDRRRTLVLRRAGSSWLPCRAAIRDTTPLMTSPRSYLTERLPFETISDLEAKRLAHDKQALIEWLDHGEPAHSYLLIRSHLYDRFAGDLAGRVVPALSRNGHEAQRADPASGSPAPQRPPLPARSSTTLTQFRRRRASARYASALAPVLASGPRAETG